MVISIDQVDSSHLFIRKSNRRSYLRDFREQPCFGHHSERGGANGGDGRQFVALFRFAYVPTHSPYSSHFFLPICLLLFFYFCIIIYCIGCAKVPEHCLFSKWCNAKRRQVWHISLTYLIDKPNCSISVFFFLANLSFSHGHLNGRSRPRES